MTYTFDLPPTLPVWIEAGRHPLELLGSDGWRELVDEVLAMPGVATPAEIAKRAEHRRQMAIALSTGVGTEWVPGHMLTPQEAFEEAVFSWWYHDLLTVDNLARRFLALLDPTERTDHLERINAEMRSLEGVRRALLTDTDPATAGEALQQFSAHQRVRGLSRRTVDRRIWSIGLWIDYLGDTPLGEGGVNKLEAFLSRWPSAQSRYSVRSDLHQFYSWAIKRGLLDEGSDPTREIPPPRIPRRSASPIHRDSVRRLIDSTTGQVRLAVLLAACAGLRTSEISNLRCEDIDVEQRRLVVRCGKGGKDDVIPLAEELADELESWPKKSGRLLGFTNGAAVGSAIRVQLRRLGIEGRPHDLRHSFGTEAARASNGNLVLVQKLMRHDAIANTERYVKWYTPNNDAVSYLYPPPINP